jgi:hypothetical protein
MQDSDHGSLHGSLPRLVIGLAEWPIRVCIKLLPPQSFGALSLQEKQARVPALG